MDDRFIDRKDRVFSKEADRKKSYWITGKGCYMLRDSLYRMGARWDNTARSYRVDDISDDNVIRRYVEITDDMSMKEIE